MTTGSKRFVTFCGGSIRQKRRPLSRSLQKIRGGLAVVNRGPRQHAGQRDLSIGGEDVKLEPFPGFRLSLAVLFAPPVAPLGQRFQHPSGTHPDISGKGRMIFGVGLDHRSLLSLFLPPSLLGRSIDLRRTSSSPFPSHDGGPVHGGMFDELRPQMRLNHGSVDPFGHVETDQLGKDAGEGRFVRNLRRILPSAHPGQILVSPQSVDQGARRGKSQDCLRDKGPAKNAPFLGGTARPLNRLFDRLFDPKNLEGPGNLLVFLGERTFKRPFKFRKERALNPI